MTAFLQPGFPRREHSTRLLLRRNRPERVMFSLDRKILPPTGNRSFCVQNGVRQTPLSELCQRGTWKPTKVDDYVKRGKCSNKLPSRLGLRESPSTASSPRVSRSSRRHRPTLGLRKSNTILDIDKLQPYRWPSTDLATLSTKPAPDALYKNSDWTPATESSRVRYLWSSLDGVEPKRPSTEHHNSDRGPQKLVSGKILLDELGQLRRSRTVLLSDEGSHSLHTRLQGAIQNVRLSASPCSSPRRSEGRLNPLASKYSVSTSDRSTSGVGTAELKSQERKVIAQMER